MSFVIGVITGIFIFIIIAMLVNCINNIIICRKIRNFHRKQLNKILVERANYLNGDSIIEDTQSLDMFNKSKLLGVWYNCAVANFRERKNVKSDEDFYKWCCKLSELELSRNKEVL